MSYDISLRVKQDELDDRFKLEENSKQISSENIEDTKAILVSYFNNLDFDKNNLIDYKKLRFNIRFNIEILCDNIITQWKQNIKLRLESEDGYDGAKDEIWFNGWDYAEGTCVEDVKDVISNFITSLWCKVTLIPKVDYYNDYNNYIVRRDEISDCIDTYCDMIYSEMSKDFVNTYRDHICGGDDYHEDSES